MGKTTALPPTREPRQHSDVPSDKCCQQVHSILTAAGLDPAMRFVMIEYQSPYDRSFGEGDDKFHAVTLVSEFRHVSLVVLQKDETNSQHFKGTIFNLGKDDDTGMTKVTLRPWEYYFTSALQAV